MVSILTKASIGSGKNLLALSMSEDAYQGDAQFTVSVDNVQVGGTQTVTAIHGSGTEELDVRGSFAAGSHIVTVNFLNDLYGGSPSADRNLYVDSVTIDGAAVAGGTLTEDSAGPQSFTVTAQGAPATQAAPITLGTGPDDLILNISENAYQGDAWFRVAVDSRQVGPMQMVSASHAAGAEQEFDIRGTFGPGNHAVAVRFLNGLNGSTPATDRSLYVDSASLDGVAIAAGSLAFHDQGAQHFSFAGATAVQPPPSAVTIGTGSDAVALQVAEDYYQGDAQFTVSVDGMQVGGTQTARVSKASGNSQEFDVKGSFGVGPHVVTVNFLNDLYNGTPSTVVSQYRIRDI